MDISEHEQFANEYKNYVDRILEPSQQDVKQFLAEWRNPLHWSDLRSTSRAPSPSPVQRFHTRIKRPESVADKILRKPGSFPAGLTSESFNAMHDALGARAIVYFLSDLPIIDADIRRNKAIDVSKDDPPVAYLSQELTQRLSLEHLERRDKESGYASVHYILRLRSSRIALEFRPWFELQVRTLAEDTWGEIEHVLGYKPGKHTTLSVRRQFQIISHQLAAIDEHFNFLHEELERLQYEVSYSDIDVLNAENLPAVLSESGLSCAQVEIDGMLKLLTSRGIDKVGQLRRLATNHRLDVIRNMYRAEYGASPSNFETVASLANLERCGSPEEEAKRIRAHFAFERIAREISLANRMAN